MLHVNLIGAQQREQQALQRVIVVCVSVAVLVLAASVWLALPGVSKWRSLGNELKELEEEIAKSQDQVNRIEGMQKQARALEPLSAMVHESQQSCVDWLRILLLIQQSTPKKVWLKELKSEFNPKDCVQSLTITGEATTDTAGAILAHNLEYTGPMMSVRNSKASILPRTDATGAAAEPVFAFTVEAQLRYVIGEYVQ